MIARLRAIAAVAPAAFAAAALLNAGCVHWMLTSTCFGVPSRSGDSLYY